MDGATVRVVPADPLPPRRGRLGQSWAGAALRSPAAAAITVVGSVLAAAALVVGLAGQRIRILAPVAVKQRDDAGQETGEKRIFFRTVPVFDT